MTATENRELQDQLSSLIERYDVPGACLAKYADGRTEIAAAGILNQETGVEVTPESVFQIGSITKTYTATLAMRLIEAGLLDLDRPVAEDLPELRLADMEVAAKVTLRHLLTHTSGIDGDNFSDTGRGDDVLERYLETCADVEQCLPLGAVFSYCNTGYGIVGRLIERVTGGTWDAALREHVLEPLGLERTVTLPEEAMRFRVAYGHVPGPEGRSMMAPHWALPRSTGPAGGITASAADVLAFARMHLDGGAAADGTRFLSSDSVAAVATPQIPVPDPALGGTHWGIGAMVLETPDGTLVGHDGGTVGQGAFLRWAPRQDTAIVLLVNGGDGGALRDELFYSLVREATGISPPTKLEPSGQPPPTNATDWAGRYERTNCALVVEATGDTLQARIELDGLSAEAMGASTFESSLEATASEDTYVTQALPGAGWMPVVFFHGPDGRRYAHMAGRAQRLVEAAS